MTWAHTECVKTHGSCPACGAEVRGVDQAAAQERRRRGHSTARNSPLEWALLLAGGLASFAVCFVLALASLSLGDAILGLQANGGTLAAICALFACLAAPVGTLVLAAWIDGRRMRGRGDGKDRE